MDPFRAALIGTPTMSNKRSRDHGGDEAAEEDERASRRPILDESFFDRPSEPTSRTAEDLLAQAETRAGVTNDDVTNDGDGSAGAIDAKHVRRLVLAFERAYAENVKARAKYGNEPRKFAES